MSHFFNNPNETLTEHNIEFFRINDGNAEHKTFPGWTATAYQVLPPNGYKPYPCGILYTRGIIQTEMLLDIWTRGDYQYSAVEAPAPPETRRLCKVTFLKIHDVRLEPWDGCEYFKDAETALNKIAGWNGDDIAYVITSVEYEDIPVDRIRESLGHIYVCNE